MSLSHEQFAEHRLTEESAEARRESLRADFIMHCQQLLTERQPHRAEEHLPAKAVYEHVAFYGNGFVDEVERATYDADELRLTVERSRRGMRLLGRQIGRQSTRYEALLRTVDGADGDASYEYASVSPEVGQEFNHDVVDRMLVVMQEVASGGETSPNEG